MSNLSFINTLPFSDLYIHKGFGQPTSWAGTSAESEISRGHAMTFRHALHVASSNIIALASLPRWVIKMSKKLSEGEKAAQELMVRDQLCFWCDIEY